MSTKYMVGYVGGVHIVLCVMSCPVSRKPFIQSWRPEHEPEQSLSYFYSFHSFYSLLSSQSLREYCTVEPLDGEGEHCPKAR
jgi:hypothetical protein